MDENAIRRAALITLPRAILERFPPGRERRSWLWWLRAQRGGPAGDVGPSAQWRPRGVADAKSSNGGTCCSAMTRTLLTLSIPGSKPPRKATLPPEDVCIPSDAVIALPRSGPHQRLQHPLPEQGLLRPATHWAAGRPRV